MWHGFTQIKTAWIKILTKYFFSKITALTTNIDFSVPSKKIRQISKSQFTSNHDFAFVMWKDVKAFSLCDKDIRRHEGMTRNKQKLGHSNYIKKDL